MKRIILTAGALALASALAPFARAGDGGVDARRIEGELKDLVGRISKAYVMIGGGSGVVISADGLMLTNDHVIAQQRKKREWRVMLPVKKRYTADLLGTDVTGDIALLKIRSDEPLPFVPLGDSDALLAGQIVVALGNPYSHALRTAEPTVTVGIVSAVHRNQWTYSDAIQTDAPLNPGNSGGPLIDLGGALVGINGRVRVRFGEKYNTGVGLAIPTNQIRRFLPILEKGNAFHGEITGLRFRAADDLAVTQVRPDTVAARAGFKAGDRIVAVGGMPVWNLNRFQGVVHAYPEGASVPFTVERDGATVTLTAELIRWETGGAQRLPADALKPGLGVKLSSETPVTGGAEIREVLPNSAASKGGLKAGDIVLAFEGKQVLGPADLEGMIGGVYEELPPRGTRRSLEVRIRYVRGLDEKEIKITLGPKPE